MRCLDCKESFEPCEGSSLSLKSHTEAQLCCRCAAPLGGERALASKPLSALSADLLTAETLRQAAKQQMLKALQLYREAQEWYVSADTRAHQLGAALRGPYITHIEGARERKRKDRMAQISTMLTSLGLHVSDEQVAKLSKVL